MEKNLYPIDKEKLDNLNINRKALDYILWTTQFVIEDNICSVIDDSEEDPHHSAVTTTNLIKCWLELKENIGEATGVKTLKEYFVYDRLPDEYYGIFEKKRKRESEYYRSEQF